MRVILFILGLLFSADGLYFASTTSMGVGEAFTVAIGIMFILWSTFYDAFKTKGFLKFIKGLFTFGMIVLVIYSGIICVVGKSDIQRRLYNRAWCGTERRYTVFGT